MSEPVIPPAAPEPVPAAATGSSLGRGILFSLAAIPIGVLLYALVGGLLGAIAGIVALIIPPITAWFFERGAGAKVAGRAIAPFIAVCAVAVILGIFAGVLGSAWAAYSSVGGEGLDAAFWTTARTRLTSPDLILPVLIGLALGAGGVFGVLRGPQSRTVAPGPQSGPPAA